MNVRRLFPFSFVLALILITLIVSSASAVVVTFTGDVINDFPAASLHIDGVGDVGSPAGAPGPLGWDIEHIGIAYDPGTDTLFVGFSMAGGAISGDADGDGDPGGTSPWLAGNGGSDEADLANTEAIDLLIDVDASCTPGSSGTATDFERVAGVPNTAGTAGFDVRDFSGTVGDLFVPGAGHTGTSYTGSLFASPSAAQPDLEFTVANFCGTVIGGGCNPGVTPLSFVVKARAGSLSDDGVGEDNSLCIPVDFTPTAVTLLDAGVNNRSGLLPLSVATLSLALVTFGYLYYRRQQRLTH